MSKEFVRLIDAADGLDEDSNLFFNAEVEFNNMPLLHPYDVQAVVDELSILAAQRTEQAAVLRCGQGGFFTPATQDPAALQQTTIHALEHLAAAGYQIKFGSVWGDLIKGESNMDDAVSLWDGPKFETTVTFKVEPGGNLPKQSYGLKKEVEGAIKTVNQVFDRHELKPGQFKN